MTVSSTSSRVVFAGNGSTTVFPFAFKVLKPADLAVVFTDAGGSDFPLSPLQYDATGFGNDAGGVVTYPASGSGAPAMAQGTRLTIYRNVAVTQPTSISNQGAMWPQVIEGALDRLTYIAQKVTDTVSRALVVSPTDGPATLSTLPNATTRANSVLGFDGSGQPYAATLQPAGLIGWASWLVSNFAAQATSAANARVALGAVGTTGNDTVGGNKTFTGNSDFTTGSIIVQTPDPEDGTRAAANTLYADRAAHRAVGGLALRSYLAGLGMANNAGTPNSKIDVAAGVCADGTNAAMLSVTGGTIDCGTVGANGLDSGSLGNSTWYHAFAIGKTDGTTALLGSTSLASPAMPTGYTLKRRIGSFLTDGSAHIVGFVQDGDYFRWKVAVLDGSDTNPGTAAQLKPVSVPAGVSVMWLGNLLVQTSTTPTSILLSDPAATNEVPRATNAGSPAAPGMTMSVLVGGLSSQAIEVRTDTSRQVRYRLSASTGDIIVGLVTLGWIDRRGRDS
jgi:hypothetical protein